MRATNKAKRNRLNNSLRSKIREQGSNTNTNNRNSSHTSTQADFEVFETEYGIDIVLYGREVQKSIQPKKNKK